jgi:hypothetical protein
LIAAIDEAERLASAATEGPWHVGGRGGATVEAEGGNVASGVTDVDAAHIAHHSPAAVLRQCAAHRRIVKSYQWTMATADEIAGRGLKPWELPPKDLDLWDRCASTLAELTPVIEDLAEGYGITD